MLSDISYSKDLRAEDNLHLASVGLGRERTAVETLRHWNGFLNSCGLPEVVRVGTGLPDDFREAGAIIVDLSRGDFALSNANAGQRSPTPSVDAETAAATAEDDAVGSGEAGPSTAAFRAAARDSAAEGLVLLRASPRVYLTTGSSQRTLSIPTSDSTARLTRRVEDAINSAMEGSDDHFHSALQFHTDLLPRMYPDESTEMPSRDSLCSFSAWLDHVRRLVLLFLG